MQIEPMYAEVEYIGIDTDKVPYEFSVKLIDRTYTIGVMYNEPGGFYTLDLFLSDGTPLCYGDPVRYGRPQFETVADERFPLPVIMPVCLTGDEIETVTCANFGKEVKLYLYDRRLLS